MHAEHEDCGVWQFAEDLLCGVEAAGTGKRAVHYYDLGLEALREIDGFIAAAGFADDVEVALIFEHAPEAFPHQTVIVNEKDSDFRRRHWHPLYRERLSDQRAFRHVNPSRFRGRRRAIRRARALRPFRFQNHWSWISDLRHCPPLRVRAQREDIGGGPTRKTRWNGGSCC